MNSMRRLLELERETELNFVTHAAANEANPKGWPATPSVTAPRAAGSSWPVESASASACETQARWRWSKARVITSAST